MLIFAEKSNHLCFIDPKNYKKLGKGEKGNELASDAADSEPVALVVPIGRIQVR